jgi:hypothetical protein
MPSRDVFADIFTLPKRPLVLCLAFVVLLTFSTKIAPLSFAVLDPDLWWHLRDGNSIIIHHAVPHQAVFSKYANHPWVAYSWGFEVILSYFYHWFGLMGLVSLRAGLEAVITSLLFLILWRGLDNFWQAWFLTAAGMLAIHHCLGLQPMLFSILMFTLEVGLIWDARRRKRPRLLFLLPILFLVWANLHIQFIYGLSILMLLAAVSVLQSILPKTFGLSLEPERDLSSQRLLIVCGLSVLATLIGPYSWQLYAVVLSYMRSSVPFNVIVELKALSFRAPGHYIFLLLVAGAFFALGWRRSRDFFQVALLVVCTVVAFRMMRDSWFACVPALAIIADRKAGIQKKTASPAQVLAMQAATLATTVLIFMLIVWDSRLDNRSLERVVATSFPVGACDFIRARSFPGPIYNDLGWGGFIIWSLPDYPVVIDGRTDIYGDALLYRYYMEQQGLLDWKSDPDLNSAKLVLLNSRTGLAMQMQDDQRFRIAYSDPIAIVFVRK